MDGWIGSELINQSILSRMDGWVLTVAQNLELCFLKLFLEPRL